jgi:toxin ParE1/3/4
MRYVFHPEALAEYSEAVRYYTEQRVEVVQTFINTIEDMVYRIRESPLGDRIQSFRAWDWN